MKILPLFNPLVNPMLRFVQCHTKLFLWHKRNTHYHHWWLIVLQIDRSKSHWKYHSSTAVLHTHLFLSPLSSSRNYIMVFVFIHHAQHAHRRLIGTTKSLQQLVMLSTDLLSHLTCGFDQFVLHQGRIVIVRLQVSLTVGRQAHQTGLLSFLLPCCAEVTQHLTKLCLNSRLVTTGGAPGFLQAAISV